MTELLERITNLVSWTNLGPAAFADEIGVPRPVISHVLSGRNKASLEVVQKILSRYKEVSPIWLVSGEGEMLTDLGDYSVPPVRRNLPTAKEEVKNSQPNSAAQTELSQKEDATTLLETNNKFAEKKTLVKVVLLYSDGSFSSYDPS
ncbi:helix-turn-helix domain-containing protein [Rufibacter tibetensis]|uniref:helix-turn-helix domain-containing protein n=1 Tax=Rufibacter tibetensis TaxID=512763 RepID=UPI000780F3D6|nr:helix-turn-helix transcriptional regulator [Rufibacter tibetensis]